MRNWIGVSLAIILLAGLVFSLSCSQGEETPIPSVPPSATVLAPTAPSGSQISTQEAIDLIQKNQNNPDFIILDVRTASEYADGHLAGAINLDYYLASFKTEIGTLDQNKQYLIYCKTGIRAEYALQIMLGMGFQKVQNLTGGIVQWTQAGYPTIK